MTTILTLTDIAVSATRTRGATCKILEKYAKNNKLETTWIKKKYTKTNQASCNKKQAQDIFNGLI